MRVKFDKFFKIIEFFELDLLGQSFESLVDLLQIKLAHLKKTVIVEKRWSNSLRFAVLGDHI